MAALEEAVSNFPGAGFVACGPGRASPGAANPRRDAASPHAGASGLATISGGSPRARPAARTSPPSGRGEGWAQRLIPKARRVGELSSLYRKCCRGAFNKGRWSD